MPGVASAYLTCPSCQHPSLLPELPSAQGCPSCAVDFWAAAEEPFLANGYRGRGPQGATLSAAGDPATLFTASASVRYVRGSSLMPPAISSGSLALTAARVTGASALAMAGEPSQSPIVDSPDPAFVAALREQMTDRTLVVDLRGMRDRPFEVCLGTGPQPSPRVLAVVSAMERACTARGLSVAVNTPFRAAPPWTLAHYVQTRLAGDAVQVQVAASLRDPLREPVRAQLVLHVLRAAAAASVA